MKLYRALAGISLFWLASGCGTAASDPSAPIDDLEQSLRGGRSVRASSSRAGRGHGHRGRRHHHHGHHQGHGTPPPVTPPSGVPCGPSDWDDLYQTVNADLASLDADDAPFQRYVSVANRARVLGCGAALDGERAAVAKLINSLSISATVDLPAPVDADETLYRIDLRDFSWDRAISVEGVAFADAWEALVASSPYAVPFVGDDVEDAQADTGTSIPVLFGNAFVAAAARAPLYYALLDIPADADDFLLNELGIDVAAVRAEEPLRAGFTAAALGGDADFLAERFDTEVRAGVVWQISKFSNDLGDLFEDPLGNPTGERELVFSLPNGFQGHILANANGQLIDTSNVLLDASETDFSARIATSFFASRASGVELTDEVRAFVLANPGDFNAAERAAILAAYPAQAQLQAVLDDDREAFFARALQLAGLDIDSSPEPVSQSFAGFNADVDSAAAAADLLLTEPELLDNLALLEPVLSVLDAGRVDRDDFSALYAKSLCVLTVVLENQVDPALCASLFP